MITPYILCGGKGERLYPLSRADRPKPFLTLGGEKTLLEQAVARVKNDIFAKPYFIASAQAAKLISYPNCLVEPESRNTAASVAFAALTQKEGAVLILPSDHIIEPKDDFIKYIKAALAVLNDYDVIVFGATPQHASALYGYIEMAKPIRQDVFTLKRFTEKPDKKTAQEYIASGNFLWNMGIFLFEASKMIKLFERHQPDLLNNIRADNFAKCEALAFDRAIMEKVGAGAGAKAAVVKTHLNWSDIGSWARVASAVEKQVQPNLEKWGRAYAFDEGFDEGAVLYSIDPHQKLAFSKPTFFVVIAGTARLDFGASTSLLHQGESLAPPRGGVLSNASAQPLSIIALEV